MSRVAACKALLCLLAACAGLLFRPSMAKAAAEVPAEIREGVQSAIDSADLGDWESIFFGLPAEVRELWGDASLHDLIEQHALGQGAYLGATMQNGILALLRNALPSMLPVLISLVAVAIITGFLRMIGDAGMDGINDLAGFVCQCFAIGIALASFLSLALRAKESILQTTAFIEIAFPVLLTLLTASGGIASSGIFHPAMAMLCSGISVALQDIVMPVILVGGVMGVLNNITERAQLGQLFQLSKTVAKWLIGLLFTLYFGVTALQGLTAGAFDGISIRTAKFAIDKLVPIVGGAVSGTVDTVLGCAMLAKNAVGLAAILLAFGVVCAPLMKVAAGMLAFRLAAALCEPIGDARIPRMLGALADVLTHMFAAALSLTVMFIITVGLIMSAGGAVF